MRLTILAAIIATVIGFVAVYASLTLSGNGEKISDATNQQKYQKMQGERLRAFIFHKEPKPFDDFKFQDAFGKTRSLSEWRGKVVLLNLWATWCAPCREEMPSLDNLKKHFSNEKFDVVTISMDRGGVSKPRKFFDEERIKYLDLFIDKTSRLMFQMKAVGLPATILLDQQGREIGRMAGPAQWDSDRAIDLVKKALLKPSQS